MAAENLRWGAEAAQVLRTKRPRQFARLCRETGLTTAGIGGWTRLADRIVENIDPRTGLIEQFDGYFKLRNVKVRFDEHGWPQLPAQMTPRQRKESQIIKQADVVLLMYLLEDQYDAKTRRANFLYYEARDHQGSSLSPNTYAIAGMAVGERERAYRSFTVSANRDLRLTQEAAAGIHAACMGGTWMAVVHGFAGLRADANGLSLNPWLPDGWQSLRFRYAWRGRRVRVVVSRRALTVELDAGAAVPLKVAGREWIVKRKECLRIDLVP
jgi:kojibiose phosphorylase